MGVNSSEMEARYSNPLPCKTCRYALSDIGSFSQAESAFCNKYPDLKNRKPSGVLFWGRPCEFYEKTEDRMDGEDTRRGVGVIVVRDGKILCGLRGDGDGFCGPGGHVQDDETDEEAAVRETQEEFGITPLHLVELGDTETRRKKDCNSKVYLATEFSGEVHTDNDEMFNPKWLTMEELSGMKLFMPFERSLSLLKHEIGGKQEDDV